MHRRETLERRSGLDKPIALGVLRPEVFSGIRQFGCNPDRHSGNPSNQTLSIQNPRFQGILTKPHQRTIMTIEAIVLHMTSSEEIKPLIQATESTRDEARVTKAKLGLTWDEFVQKATEELDPGDDY